MTQETNHLLVRQQRLESDGVLSLTLERPDGAALGEWEPGAHIDIVLPSGTVRQYSLCGDPTDKTAYRIAVLREDEGRGGRRKSTTVSGWGIYWRCVAPATTSPSSPHPTTS